MSELTELGSASSGKRLASSSPSRTGRRLHGAIARKVGVAILSGHYAPGDLLPTELALALDYDVSRSACREALKALAAKGLVESRPKTGTRVLARHRWNLLDPAVLEWAFTGQPDARLIRGLFELRGIIEPSAARLAAERRSQAELRDMKAALALMRTHTLTTEEGRSADREFHNLILQATQNDALITLSASIGAAVSWTTQFKQRARALPRNPIPDHARVYDAIAAGDAAGAERAMRDLVNLALEDTEQALVGPSADHSVDDNR